MVNVRPGCAKHPNTPTPSKKRGNVKTSDEVINKVWECVRFNNGIMALLQLQGDPKRQHIVIFL